MNDADKKAFDKFVQQTGNIGDGAREAWQAACEWRDSQVGEPVAWRHSLTHCLFETEDEIDLADGDEYAEPLYLAPPTAQINQQLVDALQNLLDVQNGPPLHKWEVEWRIAVDEGYAAIKAAKGDSN